MKGLLIAIGIGLLGLQSTSAQAPPRVVPASGVARDAGGNLLAGGVTITFAIYSEKEGGAPIWSETQALALDANGQYSTLLGATQPEGLPSDLFTKGEARWLGISVDGAPEGPRSFWASVPYALKAADAETVGGLPLDAFVLNGRYPKPGSDEKTALPAPDGDGVPPSLAGTDSPSLTANDNLYVYNAACVGVDCVVPENFGSDSIRLRENNLRIHFDDTSTGTFPANDWRIVINDTTNGGANYFAVEDSTAGRTPFLVEANSPTSSLYVDSTGRVGFRTSSPALDAHFNTSNTPALRLEQNNSGGFAAQRWDIGGNEANFFVRDSTAGDRYPFRVRPGAPTSAVDISATGRVGFGLTTPQAPIDVRGTASNIGTGNAALKLANSDGDVAFQLDAGNNSSFWNVSMRAAGEALVFSKSGTGATEATLDTGGNLTLRGNLVVGGNCSDGNGGGGGVDGCDRVFHPDYAMPTIEDHAAEMWGNGYLPAVGPTPEDAPWNIGRKAAGMLNELEKAHIYIEQLQRQLTEQQQQFDALKMRLEALERSLPQR
ncbi:MAG: hypothetical protein R2712_10235 [Vicinamibacterales bacterium]